MDRVAVRVGEARAEQSAGHVHRLGVGRHVGVAGDLAVADDEGPRTEVPVAVEDGSVDERDGRHQRPSSSGPAGSWVMPTLRTASPARASRQTRLARYAVISAWSYGGDTSTTSMPATGSSQ